MHRHERYDEKLAAELQDQEFAKDFILDLIEGEITILHIFWSINECLFEDLPAPDPLD
jgi:hypothetical protein